MWGYFLYFYFFNISLLASSSSVLCIWIFRVHFSCGLPFAKFCDYVITSGNVIITLPDFFFILVEDLYSHLFIIFSSPDDRCDSLETSDRKGSTSESQVWSYLCFARLLRLQENTSAVYICSYLVSPTVRSFCNLLEILFETFRWNNYPSWLKNNFTRAIFLLWTNSNSQFLKSYMQNWKSTSLHVISSTPTIK